MNSGQRTGLGIGLLAFGLLLGVIGLFVAWNAVQRWYAVNEVREAQSLIIHAGRFEEARRVAASAAARVPDSACAALLAADYADPASAERLVDMSLRSASRTDRQALSAAAGLIRALAGKPIEVELGDSGDGRMIAAIVAARAGKPVGKLVGIDEEAPHAAVERAAMIVLARQAWEEGRGEDLRRYAGALVILNPQQTKEKHVQVAQLVLAAVDTAAKSQSVEVLRIAGELPQESRGKVLRAVVAIAPARRQLLATQYAKDLEVAP